MTGTLALVGRPNVGKSTLFNRLTRSRDALVADLPGLTRDRQYGTALLAGRRLVLIDTWGCPGKRWASIAPWPSKRCRLWRKRTGCYS